MRPRRLKNEINVVPYIDVMLVLLVIFMVATPMMTTGSVDLPSVGKAPQAKAQPFEIDIKSDQSLVVINRADGGHEKPVDRADLTDTVLAALEKNPEQPVLIAGDKNVKYEVVLAVMDQLQRAQIKNVGLLVQTTGK